MKRSFLFGLIIVALTSLAVCGPAAAQAGWVWQNPAPRWAEWSAVDCADADHAWLVGNKGLIFATTDGGDAWARQPAGVSVDLLAVSCVSASRAWVVGAGGVVLATTNGGAAWNQQESGVGTTLNAVTFVDAAHGWAVGESGLILATADGGASWSRQQSGTTQGLISVTFVDSMHGWAAGFETLLGTVDGGVHWTPLTPPAANTIYDLWFTDALHGWIVGPGGHIFASGDGGATWQQQSDDPVGNRAFHSVSFSDPLHGWAVGEDYVGVSKSVVFVTVDGGAHWTEQPSSGLPWLTGVAAADATHAWTAGHDGTILSTTDGATWDSRMAGATDENLTAVSFPDVLHGWAVGADGAVVATADGGAHWVAQNAGVTSTLTGVSFPDTTHGWAVDDGGRIIATTDGGARWTMQQAPGALATELKAVEFTDATHGWAVGVTSDAGPTGYRGVILSTVDAGAHWAADTLGEYDYLVSVSFSDTLRGCIVGTYSAFKTSDGGGTWQSVTPPGVGYSDSAWQLTDGCFIDDLHGWVVGFGWSAGGGVIMSTSDGGQNWGQHSYGGDFFYDVDFVDERHGWVLGGGVVASTSDGSTWVTQDVGCVEGLNAMVFTDAGHGWLVGGRGAILATTNGGSTMKTTAAGLDEWWHKGPVPVTLTAVDPPGGSGILRIAYKTGPGAWASVPGTGATVTLTPPADHSWDGLFEFSYYAVGNSYDSEPIRTGSLYFDTRKPGTRASAAAGYRRKVVALRYKVVETAPCEGTATATIKVKNRAGKVVKTMRPTQVSANRALTWKFKVPGTWRAGTYRFYVYAKDTAGNTQANTASAKLIVK